MPGIDTQIDQHMALGAWALQQRYARTKQLVDLLALQKLSRDKADAARAIQASMQNNPASVKDQLEQQLMGAQRQEVSRDIQSMLPGVQQQGRQMAQQRRPMPQQMAQQRPPMPQQMAQQRRPMPQQMAQQRPPMPQGQGGMPQLAAPNMSRMAGGGIVSFQNGGGPIANPNQPRPAVRESQGLSPDAQVFLDFYITKEAALKSAFDDNERAMIEAKFKRTTENISSDAKMEASQYTSQQGGMYGGGRVKGYAGPDGSEVEKDSEELPITSIGRDETVPMVGANNTGGITALPTTPPFQINPQTGAPITSGVGGDVGTDERGEGGEGDVVATGAEALYEIGGEFANWANENRYDAAALGLMLIPGVGWVSAGVRGLGVLGALARPLAGKYTPRAMAQIRKLWTKKNPAVKYGPDGGRLPVRGPGGQFQRVPDRVTSVPRALTSAGIGTYVAGNLFDGGEGSGTGDGEVQTAEGEGKVVQTPKEVAQTADDEGKREIDTDALTTFLLGMGGATSVAGALGGGGRAVQAEEQRLEGLDREESQFARTLEVERERLTAASQRVFDQLAQSTTIAQQQMAMDMLKVLQGSLPPPDYASATKDLQEKYADDPEAYGREMEKFTAEYIQRALRITTGLPSRRVADVDPALEALLKQYDPPSV